MHGAMAAGEASSMPVMAALPTELAQFRAVLHPVWHAELGPQRDADSCAQGATFRQRADAVAAAPVPEAAHGDEAGWRGATGALQRSSAALAAACEAAPRQGVADQLTAVHTSFHALLGRVGVHAPPGR